MKVMFWFCFTLVISSLYFFFSDALLSIRFIFKIIFMYILSNAFENISYFNDFNLSLDKKYCHILSDINYHLRCLNLSYLVKKNWQIIFHSMNRHLIAPYLFGIKWNIFFFKQKKSVDQYIARQIRKISLLLRTCIYNR